MNRWLTSLSVAIWLSVLSSAYGDKADEAIAALKQRGASVTLAEETKAVLIAFSAGSLSDDDVENLETLSAAGFLHVTLRGNDFTDRDAELLSRIKGLQRFALITTKVTPALIDKLHKSFPNLSIVRSDGPHLGLALTQDLEVRRSFPGSAAENAGVLVGDRIVGFDGRKISKIQELLRLVSRSKPGDVVELGIERGGKSETVELRIGKLAMQ